MIRPPRSVPRRAAIRRRVAEKDSHRKCEADLIVQLAHDNEQDQRLKTVLASRAAERRCGQAGCLYCRHECLPPTPLAVSCCQSNSRRAFVGQCLAAPQR